MTSAIKESVPNTVRTIASRQGKFSGQLRASNNVGINTTDESVINVDNYIKDAISGTTDLAKRNAQAVMTAFRLGQHVIISNNHEYAVYDEYKHGRMAYEGGSDQYQAELDRAIVT